MLTGNQYPLSCVCSHRIERFQLKFAQQALKFFPERAERSIAGGPEGLIVSAETEVAIADVVDVLKSVYGEDLVVGKLTIGYRCGTVLEEPHMGVRVLCPAQQFEAMRDDLVSRGAKIYDAEVVPPIGVVRATVALSKILGYSRYLADLTGGRAREVIWLSHYALVEPLPPDGSAA
jgi:hypothetical protein